LLHAVRASANNAANRAERVIFLSLRDELKLNQLRRTTFSPTEWHAFYQQ